MSWRNGLDDPSTQGSRILPFLHSLIDVLMTDTRLADFVPSSKLSAFRKLVSGIKVAHTLTFPP